MLHRHTTQELKQRSLSPPQTEEMITIQASKLLFLFYTIIAAKSRATRLTAQSEVVTSFLKTRERFKVEALNPIVKIVQI